MVKNLFVRSPHVSSADEKKYNEVRKRFVEFTKSKGRLVGPSLVQALMRGMLAEMDEDK
jgi:hypothetical protein